MSQTGNWSVDSQPAAPSAARADQPAKQARRGVIERTLADISGTLEQALFAEEIARRRGLLQTIDPRVKVISILALLIATSLSRSLAVVAALYLVTLGLAWPS